MNDTLKELESAAGELHGFVARRMANPDDAADIAQQTLLIAFTKRGTFRGGNFRAWLFTIARHLIVDHYRTRNRVQFVEVEEAAQTETEPTLRTSREEVPEVCENRDRLRCYLCITHRLHPAEQVAVLLADVHGHRDRDSAAMLEVSVPTFKLLLHQARARLKQIAGGCCSLVSEKPAHRGTGVSAAGTRDASIATTPNGANGHERKNGHGGNGNHRAPAQTWGAAASLAPTSAQRWQPAAWANGEPQSTPANCRQCPLAAECKHAVECRQGLKCCRRVPTLLTLRDRLLAVLSLGSLFQFLCWAGWNWGESLG
ncbi:MAG: RNA polymerase sigma factor [Verrucomicrobia bacterium]|nr:RNA polymerase sigma factor [Verrucomicrobiota bacterium]